MLGVKTTTDSVSRFNASRLAPNIGLERAVSYQLSALRKTQTRSGGYERKLRGRYLTTE